MEATLHRRRLSAPSVHAAWCARSATRRRRAERRHLRRGHRRRQPRAQAQARHDRQRHLRLRREGRRPAACPTPRCASSPPPEHAGRRRPTTSARRRARPARRRGAQARRRERGAAAIDARRASATDQRRLWVLRDADADVGRDQGRRHRRHASPRSSTASVHGGRRGHHRRRRRHQGQRGAGAAERPRAAGSEPMPSLIALEDVTKIYHMGDVEVHALRGVTSTIERGRVRRHHGRVGLGQVDADEHPRLPRSPDAPARYLLDGRDVSRSTATSSPTSATARSASCSRASTCWRAPARSRTSSCRCSIAGVPTQRAASTRAERGARARRPRRRASTTTRASSRAASSSAWPSRARSSTSRKVILADEPTGNLDSRTSIEVMALFQELGRAGITVVLVTHEPDIAAYAARVVVMQDGARHVATSGRRRRRRRRCARCRRGGGRA